MKFGDGVEASIHCAALLAGLDDDATIPGSALAHRFGLSPSYLQKHLKALTSAGILESVPGAAGGCWAASGAASASRKRTEGERVAMGGCGRDRHPGIPAAAGA